MTRPSRARFLLSLVDDLVSPSRLILNPFLLSCLTPSNRISVSDLAESPAFQRIGASEPEILECCAKSQFLDAIGNGHVALRYDLRPQILIIKDASLIASAFEIRDFVRLIKGDPQFTAFPIADGQDIAVHFDSIEQCIAVWRALQLIPFRGCRLNVEIYAPDSPNAEMAPPVGRAAAPVAEPDPKPQARSLSYSLLKGLSATANVT
jgi:hypothetical protein